MTDKTTMRDAALAYIARGWRVFPCHTPRFKTENDKAKCSCGKSDCGNIGKHPRTSNGVKGASNDAEQIAAWWQKWPDANIGIATGRTSGFIILDIDNNEGEEIFAQHPGALEIQTRTIQTGNGRQFYFDYPSIASTARVKNGVKILPGIDSRGEGGYVIAPPSLHASGRRYEVQSEAGLAPAPAWWLELVTVDDNVLQAAAQSDTAPALIISSGADYSAYVQKAFEGEIERIGSAPVGEQNEALNRAAFSLGQLVGAGVLSESEVEGALIDAALHLPALASRGPWTRQNALPTIQSGLRAGQNKPRQLPAPNRNHAVLLRSSAARAYIKGTPIERAEAEQESEPDAEGADEDEKAVNNGIYALLNGRTVLAVNKSKDSETGQNETTNRQFVCDWAAHIVGEVRDEEGQTIFDIEGRTISGRTFAMSLLAAKTSDTKLVAGAFLNVIGVSPVLFAGMEKHVVPALRSFSDPAKARRIRRYNRVGWTRESESDLSKREFIMPGMLASDVDVTGLDKHLAYRVEVPQVPELSAEAAEALKALIESQEVKHTLIALTTAFVAPLSLLCDWGGDKYAVFIAGRTGSFKTSFCQMLLCLFGDFTREESLIKFGQGTTANSLQAILTRASYMPLLVDNFKTNVGKGSMDAVGMIQAALEGGEKIRLNRNAEIRETKPIHAWMFLTGEDYVEDAASRARSLYLPFAYYGDANENLSRVQELAHALPQIGGHLLAWALTDEALIVADYVKSRFGARRSHWAGFIRKHNKEAVNAYRVASNIAVCELGWEMVLGCPALAPHLSPYSAKFHEGLEECARSMAFLTAETHEATRYLDALRELIASDRAYLCERLSDPAADERRLKIGWQDEKGVYLIPGVAFEAAVKAMASQGGLNSMSKNALHKQLAQQEHLARHQKDAFTVSVRTGVEGAIQTVLHIKRESIFGGMDL